MDVVTLGAALKGAKSYTDASIASLQNVLNRIVMDDDENTILFIQSTQPTGSIPEGSIWINTAVNSE